MTEQAPASTNRRRSLAISLLRAREAVMSRFRPMLAEHGVTEQQWRVLRVLAEDGTLDATEVAARAFILGPSLTRMIKSLEERSFIVKFKDDNDGRRVLLSISPAGRSFLDDVMPTSRRIYEEIDAQFGKERTEALLNMLEELATLRLEPAAGETMDAAAEPDPHQ